jgi:tetratricopeptide (TPR) repeat protein
LVPKEDLYYLNHLKYENNIGNEVSLRLRLFYVIQFLHPGIAKLLRIKLNELGYLDKVDEPYMQVIFSLDKLIISNYRDARLWYKMGIVLDQLGQYDDAIDCYKQVIAIKDDYAQTWNRKGITHMKKVEYDKAVECFDKALRNIKEQITNWDFADLWNNKGISLFNLGRYKEAFECFNTAVHKQDNYGLSWHNQGITLLNQGNDKDARRCFNKAKSCRS